MSATNAVAANWLDQGDNYSLEQAGTDFAVGFLSDLAGGEIGELVATHGVRSVARGFARAGVPLPGAATNLIQSADDLVSVAGISGFSRGKGGVRIGAVENGDATTVLRNILRQNGVDYDPNVSHYNLPGGGNVGLHPSSSTGGTPTIDYNNGTDRYKIRVGS